MLYYYVYIENKLVLLKHNNKNCVLIYVYIEEQTSAIEDMAQTLNNART